MSKYCGKCDFGDTYEILGDRVKNVKVFIGNNIVPLKMETYKDFLPYFPFLVGSMASSDEGTVVFLDSRSYIDREEEDRLKSSLYWIKREYKSLKRKGEEITVDKLISEFSRDPDRELARAVIESNGKCDVPDGIHLELSEHYRKSLYEDMIKEGWDEQQAYRWVYGLDRWLDKLHSEYGNEKNQTN